MWEWGHRVLLVMCSWSTETQRQKGWSQLFPQETASVNQDCMLCPATSPHCKRIQSAHQIKMSYFFGCNRWWDENYEVFTSLHDRVIDRAMMSWKFRGRHIWKECVKSVQAVFLPAEVDIRWARREGHFVGCCSEVEHQHQSGCIAYIWCPIGYVNNPGFSSVNIKQAATNHHFRQSTD